MIVQFVEVLPFFISNHRECLTIMISILLFFFSLLLVPQVFHLGNLNAEFFHLFISLIQAHSFQSFDQFHVLFLFDHYEVV